jgi:carbon storage regulator
MLVLSRKKNESIVIDGSIVITVVEIRGDKVRLGIEAPREVSIHRQEVFAAIAAEAQSSVSAPETHLAGDPETHLAGDDVVVVDADC